MRYFIIISLLLFFIYDVQGQIIKLQDDNILIKVEFIQINDSLAQFEASIKNKGEKNIYLYQEEHHQTSYLSNFVGIGLYSHIEPYLPIHTEKFKLINISKIESQSQSVVKGTLKWESKKPISISLDYYVASKKKHKGKERITLELDSYDKCMRRLKADFATGASMKPRP